MSDAKKQPTQDKKLPKGWLYVFAIAIIVTAILSITIFVPRNSPTNALFTVNLRYLNAPSYEGAYYGDYASAIATNLREIGVDVNLLYSDHSQYLTHLRNRDYDLAIIEVEGGIAPHLELFYKGNASLNFFNFDDSLDDGYVLNRLLEAEQELDYIIRRGIYYDVQDYLMQSVLPMIPLLTPVHTYGYWDNLVGFDPELGISDSLPYMSFSETHDGQESLDELIIGAADWELLNPLSILTQTEKIIASLFMDKLISIDSDGQVSENGLVKNWKYENATSLLLNIREEVLWQPDANGSMTMPFTIDDLKFTLSVLQSPLVYHEYEQFDWIKSITDVNETALIINIDSNPETSANEHYAYALEDLSVYPLPSHYFDMSDSLEDIVQSPNWVKYLSFPFGTGKYSINLDETQVGFPVVLDKFDSWHGHGVKKGVPTNLAFDTVYINPFTDTYALTLDLQNGGVDFAFFGKDSKVIEDISVTDIKIATSTMNSFIFLAINLDHTTMGGENNFVNTTEDGISKALAIRKAIASVIDKNQLNEGFHQGRYNLTDAPLSYYYPYYYTGITRYDYSINQAIEYIRLAGFFVPDFSSGGNTAQSPFNFTSGVLSLLICSIIMFKYAKRNVRQRKING